MDFFTIGYGAFGGKTVKEDFIAALKAKKVQTIVDVRWIPNAAMGLFTKAKLPSKGIEKILLENDIRYVWFKTLGNEWHNQDNWEPEYKKYLRGVVKDYVKCLSDLHQPFCLLCGCKDPALCHRTVLAEHLVKVTGWTFTNIQP